MKTSSKLDLENKQSGKMLSRPERVPLQNITNRASVTSNNIVMDKENMRPISNSQRLSGLSNIPMEKPTVRSTTSTTTTIPTLKQSQTTTGMQRPTQERKKDTIPTTNSTSSSLSLKPSLSQPMRISQSSTSSSLATLRGTKTKTTTTNTLKTTTQQTQKPLVNNNNNHNSNIVNNNNNPIPSLKRSINVAGLVKPNTRQQTKSPKLGLPENIENIDLIDANDPAQVSEYVEDIYEYLYTIEVISLYCNYNIY
jgi:hypothetical protein